MGMPTNPTATGLQQLIKKYGFMPDSDLIEFGEIVALRCVEIARKYEPDEQQNYISYASKEIQQEFGIK